MNPLDCRLLHARSVVASFVAGIVFVSWAPPLGAGQIDTTDIFRSVPFGTANPEGTSGISVSDTQFIGARFEVTSTVLTGSLGGHFGWHSGRMGNGRLFGAIVSLTDAGDFPDTMDLSSTDVVAHSLIPVPPRRSDQVASNIDATLTPGWDMLMFGSGLFGATADGFSPGGNDSGQGYDLVIKLTVDTWRVEPDVKNFEFFLSTAIVPEPSSAVILLTGLIATFAGWRRRALPR